jgi:hypothetical protein
MSETFRIVENENEEMAAIEIMKGEFKGLVYQYGKIQFFEDEVKLSFERFIRRLPENDPKDRSLEELNTDTDLQTVMGNILVHLIDEQEGFEKEENGRNRKNNTERTDTDVS